MEKMTEFFLQHMWLLWIFFATAFFLLELSSGYFILMCFALGAIICTFVAACNAPFWAQMLSFFIISPIFIFLFRKRILLYFPIDIIGSIGVVSKVIPVQGHGSVKIGGDNWKAISSLDVPLQVGMAVKVIGFDGIVIKVKPVNMPYNTYIANEIQ